MARAQGIDKNVFLLQNHFPYTKLVNKLATKKGYVYMISMLKISIKTNNFIT